MEEIEVPTEHLQEEINEQAHSSRERWISSVALSSALLAGFAAVTALLAGHHANEAMVDQIRASDQWGYYQAKGIKAAILGTKIEMMQALGKFEGKSAESDTEKLSKYKEEQEEISREAKEKEHAAESHLHHHVIFARGVTLFQVAIAVAAISVLTRRKRFFLVGLCFGAGGLIFLLQGILLPM